MMPDDMYAEMQQNGIKITPAHPWDRTLGMCTNAELLKFLGPMVASAHKHAEAENGPEYAIDHEQPAQVVVSTQLAALMWNSNIQATYVRFSDDSPWHPEV